MHTGAQIVSPQAGGGDFSCIRINRTPLAIRCFFRIREDFGNSSSVANWLFRLYLMQQPIHRLFLGDSALPSFLRRDLSNFGAHFALNWLSIKPSSELWTSQCHASNGVSRSPRVYPKVYPLKEPGAPPLSARPATRFSSLVKP